MLSILKRPSQATQAFYQTKKANKAHLIEILSCLNKKCSPENIQNFLEVIKSVQKAVNVGKAFSDIAKNFFVPFQDCQALDISNIDHNFKEIIFSIKKIFLESSGTNTLYSDISCEHSLQMDLFVCLFLAAQREKKHTKDVDLFGYVNCTKTIEQILEKIHNYYVFDQKFSSTFMYYTGHLDKDKKPTGNGFFSDHCHTKIILSSDGQKIYQNEYCKIIIGSQKDEYIINHQNRVYHFIFEKEENEKTSFDTYLKQSERTFFRGTLTVTCSLTKKTCHQQGNFKKNFLTMNQCFLFSLYKGSSINSSNKNTWYVKNDDAQVTMENGVIIEVKLNDYKMKEKDIVEFNLSSYFDIFNDFYNFKMIFSNGHYSFVCNRNHEIKIDYFSSSDELQKSYVQVDHSFKSRLDNQGRPHGFGTLTYPDGTYFYGFWKNGVFQKQLTNIFFPTEDRIVNGLLELDLNDKKPVLTQDQTYIDWDKKNGVILQKHPNGKEIKFEYQPETLRAHDTYYYDNQAVKSFKGTCSIPITEQDSKKRYADYETRYTIDAEWTVETRDNHRDIVLKRIKKQSYLNDTHQECIVKYYSADGMIQREYKGPLDESDRPHGKGTMSYADGTKFRGIWEKGLFSKQPALITYPDGKSIEGYFQLDVSQKPILDKSAAYTIKKDDQGTIIYTKSDGSIRKIQYKLSEWKPGDLLRGTLFIYSSCDDFLNEIFQSKYTGPLDTKLKPHGQGNIEYPDQTSFSCAWQHGQCLGYANRFIDANGIIYEGEFTLDQNLRPILDKEQINLIWNQQEGKIVLNKKNHQKTLNYNIESLDENLNYTGSLSYKCPSLDEEESNDDKNVTIEGVWKINDKVGATSFHLVKILKYHPQNVIFNHIPEKIASFQLKEEQPVLKVLSQDEVIAFISKRLDNKYLSTTPVNPKIVSEVIKIFTPSRMTSFAKRMERLLPQNVCSAFFSDVKIREGLVAFLTRIKNDCDPSKPQRTRDFMQLAWNSFLEFMYFLCQEESVIPLENKKIALIKFSNITLACDESIPVRINDICISLKQKTPFCDPYRFQKNCVVESFIPKFLELCKNRGHPIYAGMHIHVLPFLANHVARAFNFETDHQSEKDPYAQQAWGEENGRPAPTMLYQILCALDPDKMSEDLLHPVNQAFIQHRKENHVESTRESVLADLYQKLSPYLGLPLCWAQVQTINENILEERLKNLCGSTDKRTDFDDRPEYFQANEDGTEFWLNPQLLFDLPYFVTLHLKDLGYLKQQT